MSREALLALAREAMNDYQALLRIRAMTDRELRQQGLDEVEILAVREGFVERLMALGVRLDGDGTAQPSCC